MKSYLIPTLALGWLVSSALAQDKPDLTNPKLKASYAIGANIGSNIKAQNLDLDNKTLATGFADALAGKSAMNPEETHAVLAKFQQDILAKHEHSGETFLAENAKKEGVKTTASGLQYKVMKSGTGDSPKLTDRVKVHYHGTLIDGTVFDSSVQRGEPITFEVSGVIPGWTEALQLMKVGDKWQLFIPAKLAYGEQSPSPKIPPNSPLIFEVELLAIEK